MARKENRVQTIVRLTAKHFPSFGNSKLSTGNPFSYALKDRPPSFATGVDIEQVVRFILAKQKALEYTYRQKIGNDARDTSYTSGLLKHLSNQGLDIIRDFNQIEIRQRLRSKDYPFAGLSKETREKLLHLPISWIREGAQWQLNSRKPAISLDSSLLR